MVTTRALSAAQAAATARAVMDSEDAAAAPSVMAATCKILDAAEAAIEQTAKGGHSYCVLVGREMGALFSGVRGRHRDLALANAVAVLCARGYDASGDISRIHILRISFAELTTK